MDGDNDEMCRANCSTLNVVGVDVVEADTEKEEHYCQYFDEEHVCRFSFVYSDDDSENKIRASSKLDCPAKIIVLGIVLGVIAAIVLIGLAILLLWKILTTIHDRREFARFEKERMMAKFDTVRFFLTY